MKTRNKLLTLLILSAGAATTTALINKAVKPSCTRPFTCILQL